MPTWYLGKIRYQKEEIRSGRGGDQVRMTTITDQYILDAVSHTDAEAILYQTVADNTPDFTIPYINPIRISDVFFCETGESWYACKVVFETEDDNGRQKKLSNLMYINAEHEKQAIDELKEQLKTILMPYEIVEVKKTKILDVIPFTGDNDERKNQRTGQKAA